MQSRSLSDVMTSANGRPSGFDYLRLILALGVVVSHSFNTAQGPMGYDMEWDSPARPALRLILPMFFALSGFLVAGSMERSKTLVKFLGLRLIRIYPALSVEVLLSAFILGPLVTTLPLTQYFTHPLFIRYLWNVTGDISFALPGAFATNPIPGVVNGQLWTVPFELGCYVLLGVLIAIGAKKWRGILPSAAVLLLALWTLYGAYKTGWAMHEYYRALGGPQLVASFLLGVSLYAYRSHIRHSWALAAVSAVASVILLGVVPFGSYLAIFPAAYVTVFIGLLNPPRQGWIKGADYSYGVFLYGFVIEQATMYALPWARAWYLNAMICIPISLLVAAASWHLIEKPAMKLKAVVDFTERRYLALRLAIGVPLRHAGGVLGG